MKSTPGAQVEDFIPWVRPELSWRSASEQEEEEEEMKGLVDRYAPGSETGRRMPRGRPIEQNDRTGSLRMGVRRCRQS